MDRTSRDESLGFGNSTEKDRLLSLSTLVCALGLERMKR